MFRLTIRPLLNLPSASVRTRSGPGSRRRACRVAPRLFPLEVRALLSTITVTNDGDSGYGSLRGALASAVSGDTIKFAPSAYGTIKLTSGPLEVTSSVTIGGPGANKVAIDGNKTFEDLLVAANVTASVSGLTITDGAAPDTYPYGGGGLFNGGTLTVANCVVSNNNGGFYGIGGGIFNNGTLSIADSVVSNNYAGNEGIGGGINNNGTLTVTGSTITNNSTSPSGFGGGGIANAGTLTVNNSLISNNTGTNGGGIYSGAVFGQGNVTITGSVVSNNTAASGGGLSLSGSTATISRSTFANNTAGNSNQQLATGGGIEANGGNVTVSGSQFVDNTALSTTEFGTAIGGGIWIFSNYAPSASNLNVTNSTFQGNTARGFFGYGGALDAENDTNVTVTGTSFSSNSATGDLNASGGAVRIETYQRGTAQATFSGSTFIGNGAIVASTSTDGGSASGGAIYNIVSPLTISGSTFIANQAVAGAGGGFGVGGAIQDVNDVALTLSNSLLIDNSAIGGSGGGWGVGGGLSAFLDATTVDDTSFFGNQAIGGAATQAGNRAGLGLGGAIQIEGITFTLTNSTLQLNQAIGGAATDGATAGNGEGGGIENAGNLTVNGGLITNNSAIGGAGGGAGQGGGVYNSGTAAFAGGLITLNSAIGGSGGGQGKGGGLYISAGTVTLSQKTKVVGNFASTSNDNIYGPYSTI